MTRSKLVDLARTQHGLLRTDDLVSAGLRPSKSLGASWLERPMPNVYRIAGSPWTWEQTALVAVWSQPVEAWLSHRSAARVWELGLFNDRAIDVVCVRHERRAKRDPRIRLHETTKPRFVDGTTRRGLPVTSVERTIIDLAGLVRPVRTEEAFETAKRRELLDIGRLRWLVGKIGYRRRGIRLIRRFLSEHDPQKRPADSLPELEIRWLLLAAGLPEPVLQHPIRLAGTLRYLDLAYPDERVAIEFHGEGSHLSRSGFHGDTSRRNQLELQGWRYLEYTWPTLRGEPDRIVREVWQLLR